jgi:hypothetical protein
MSLFILPQLGSSEMNTLSDNPSQIVYFIDKISIVRHDMQVKSIQLRINISGE